MRNDNWLFSQVLCQECGILTTAFFTSLLGCLLDCLNPYFIGQALSAMQMYDFERRDAVMRKWMFLLFWCAIFSSVRDYLFLLTGEKVGSQIRLAFFRCVLRKDIGFYDERKTGDFCKYFEFETFCRLY